MITAGNQRKYNLHLNIKHVWSILKVQQPNEAIIRESKQGERKEEFEEDTYKRHKYVKYDVTIPY